MSPTKLVEVTFAIGVLLVENKLDVPTKQRVSAFPPRLLLPALITPFYHPRLASTNCVLATLCRLSLLHSVFIAPSTLLNISTVETMRAIVQRVASASVTGEQQD